MAKRTTSKLNEYTRTRQDHASELAEDYVEAIAELTETLGMCRSVDLAKRFAVSHVSVNRKIARLARDGWVRSEPYGPIALTDAGKTLAKNSKRRHQIVYQFLLALGIRESTARSDTEGIEHHVSEETLRAMKRFSDSLRRTRNAAHTH